MIKWFFLTFISATIAQSTEHFFNYSDITSPGEITEFPANFGSFKQAMSFSGSLTALSRLSYRPNLNSYQAESAPVSIEPRVLSSGLGKSWGGWGFVIKNNVEKTKLVSETLESTEDLRFIEVHLGSGLKLSTNWNIGWSLSLENDQQVKTEILTNSGSDTPVRFTDTQNEIFSTRIGFGFLYESESFLLGTHMQTPKGKLSRKGVAKTRAWSVSQNQIQRTDEKFDPESFSNWDLDIGVKFGTSGFSYSIADTYHFAGTHELKGGFEYVGSWGRISTGLSRHQQSNLSEWMWSLGYCRSQKEFEWGVGPYYKTISDRMVDRNEVGVLYSSQINY